jgi:hypothetical protein
MLHGRAPQTRTYTAGVPASARIQSAPAPLLRRPVGEVARAAWSRAKPALRLEEEHVWLARDLDELPELPLPEGAELRRATVDDLALAADAGRDPALVQRYIEAGHELWMLVHDGRAAFSAWIFHGTAPAIAARGGWLELPPGVVCMEDSLTHPDYRGRGFAPGAALGMFRAVRDSGIDHVVTKIELSNDSSRRAAAKAGFYEVATMRFTRIGPHSRTRLAEVRGDVGAQLAASLER